MLTAYCGMKILLGQFLYSSFEVYFSLGTKHVGMWKVLKCEAV